MLGPLEVRDGERSVALGGAKPRSVLAILLLHAGEVVSVDRLIDLVWGESPPEDAATALHQHVSRLRKALDPHEVIVTRSPGYLVDPAEGQLDLRRFEGLRAAARRLLDDDRAAEAAEVLREALGLWRGRPLGDLADEPFAAEAVARLDEEWLEAVELRIEADLVLGRHGELVGELQTLVRRHPLRERLRAQLILALYRSGRQADALEVYADGRRILDAELGLEPGPELRRLQQAILEQDPALELDRPRRGPGARRARHGVLAGAALAVAAIAAMAAVVLPRGDDEPDRIAAPDSGGALVAVDATTGAVGPRLRVGRTPAAVASGGGRLWVIDADARTLLAVDPGSGRADALSTGGTPTEVAVGPDGVWVANGRPIAGAQFVGPVATEVVRVDPATRTQRATVELPRPRGAVVNAADNRLAATADAVWAVSAAGSVVRIDTATSVITAVNERAGAMAVAAGGAGVFALRPDGVVLDLDERTARARRRTRIPTDGPSGLAVGESAVWATSAIDGTLWRIGPDGELGAVEVGSGAGDVVASASATWVANPTAGTLSQVDPVAMRVRRTVPVDGVPRALALDGETVWAAVAGQAPATTSHASGVEALPDSICEPVVAGAEGNAELLIVSDLPLQGGVRVTATQMAQAITFVLRERGFRAGSHRVAYQSCDDSIARTGLFDEAKCAENARSYAADHDVVAVIGTLNSPCAVAAVPELNRAPGGPLAMVSPLNSFVGLTRGAPGVPADLLAKLYPTGRRNYLRVYPTDDLQGAALALLARDRGRRRVFVLDDGEPGYGLLMARGFATAAGRLDLTVAGRATWNPSARSYRALARRVDASGATAVFVGGLLDTNAGRVVRDLRAVLGREVDLMGPDGLTPLPLLAESAGPAARGVFVSLAGLITEELPAAGAEWAERFARTQPGVEVEPSAVYAAQAAEVVLDAIARSDGTRTSVLDALFRSRVREGLLGDFAFDERGDITESPVTIMRLATHGRSRRIQSIEGGVVERVSRPRADLVAGG